MEGFLSHMWAAFCLWHVLGFRHALKDISYLCGLGQFSLPKVSVSPIPSSPPTLQAGTTFGSLHG